MNSPLGENIDLNSLPTVLKDQYQLVPGEDRKVSIEGDTEMIDYPKLVGVLLSIVKVLGVDLPHKGENIPTELIRTSKKDDLEHTFWERIFNYPDGKKVVLKSKFHSTESGVVEWFKYGVSFEMDVKQTKQGIEFYSTNLSLNVFGLKLPIPSILTPGKLKVVQEALSENEYDFSFEFKHPVFGRTYFFNGVYKVIEEA